MKSMVSENIVISAASTNLRIPCSSQRTHLKMVIIVYVRIVVLNREYKGVLKGRSPEEFLCSVFIQYIVFGNFDIERMNT